MIRPPLCGIETEYGLAIAGRGPQQQIEDSAELVRAYPGPCFVGWDYRAESPRSDLRGFRVEHLAMDPVDAQFDVGVRHASDVVVRSDRVLPNGARFYNDHGHPEYSTPECWSPGELARHDLAGEIAVRRAAAAYAEQSGHTVSVIKNNTDFHGASYGTHESYCVHRSLGFEGLFRAVVPMLVARQILVGAGKAGAEHGTRCPFQISQRADFFTEAANVETLYRRPIFNTRDEPHADPANTIRLHVIATDASRLPACTARKAALMQIALILAQVGEVPEWSIEDPVRAYESVSKDQAFEFRICLGGSNWTTAAQVLESYFAAAERHLSLSDEHQAIIEECRALLAELPDRWEALVPHVDWAAKRWLLQSIGESEDVKWGDPAMASYDLAYADLDPDSSLFQALIEMEELPPPPDQAELLPLLETNREGTRARARGHAVRQFGAELKSVTWGSLTFQDGTHVKLDPWKSYPEHIAATQTVGEFRAALENL